MHNFDAGIISTLLHKVRIKCSLLRTVEVTSVKRNEEGLSSPSMVYTEHVAPSSGGLWSLLHAIDGFISDPFLSVCLLYLDAMFGDSAAWRMKTDSVQCCHTELTRTSTRREFVVLLTSHLLARPAFKPQRSPGIGTRNAITDSNFGRWRLMADSCLAYWMT